MTVPPEACVDSAAMAPTVVPSGGRLGQYNRAGGAQRLMIEAPSSVSLKARLVLPLSLLGMGLAIWLSRRNK